MDRREVSQYLAALYEPAQQFEVAYIGDKAPARVKRHATEELLDEMERAEQAGYNVYTSALPCDIQDTGTYDRIWVDQDDHTAPWPWTPPEEGQLASWPWPTTLVRTSSEGDGFRWQAIYKLKQPMEASEARDLMKRLADTIGADGSVTDRRRVLRVPGILNAKRQEFARIISIDSRTLHLPVSFDDCLPAVEATTIVDRILAAPSARTRTQDILGEWLAGVSEGERSRKAYVAARFLKSCGVSWQDAGAILLLGASRSQPPFPEDELEQTLNSAYKRAD